MNSKTFFRCGNCKKFGKCKSQQKTAFNDSVCDDFEPANAAQFDIFMKSTDRESFHFYTAPEGRGWLWFLTLVEGKFEVPPTKEIGKFWRNDKKRRRIAKTIVQHCGVDGANEEFVLHQLIEIAKDLEENAVLQEENGQRERVNFEENEVVDIDISDIFFHVGEAVRFTGRVTTTIDGVKETLNGYKKQMIITVDGLDGKTVNNVHVKYFLDDRKDNPYGVVKVTGVVEAVPQKNRGVELPDRLLVDAIKIEPSTLSVEAYTCTEETEKEIKKYFGSITNDNIREIIDGAIAPHIVGRSLEKLACALTWFSPREIPVSGKKQFLLTALLSGDSRTAKDEIARDLVENLSPQGAVRVNAEQARKTGLIGACVQDSLSKQWAIVWGRLVEADGCGAVLSGISGYDSEAWSQLREILHERMASIEKVVKGKKAARTRLILTGNSRENVKLYYSPYHALRDTGSYNNVLFGLEPDWMRIHIPVCFGTDDVDNEDVDNAAVENVERSIPEDVFVNKVADTWRRDLDGYDIESIRNMFTQIKRHLNELRKSYGGVSLAILGKEGIKIFISLMMSVATIKHRVNNDGQIVVDKEDAEFVYAFIEELLIRLGIPKVKEKKERLDSEAQRIADFLIGAENYYDEGLVTYILAYRKIILALYYNNPLSSERLANIVNFSRATLWNYKGRVETSMNLNFPIISSKPRAGFSLTSFGMMVAKKIKLGIDAQSSNSPNSLNDLYNVGSKCSRKSEEGAIDDGC